MDILIIITSLVILISLGLISQYYSGSSPLPLGMVNGNSSGKHKVNIPLYVYESTGNSSRKWLSFRDRMSKNTYSPYLQLCDNTHIKNHTIGKIIPVNDNDLLQLLEDYPEENPPDLQYHRLLRDSLLLKLVSKEGGIIIPRHVFLMEDTKTLFSQAQEPGTILYAGSGNNEYGCPIIVSNGGNEEYANMVVSQVKLPNTYGGVEFGGGLPLVLNRSRKMSGNVNIQELSGVREMSVRDLTQIGEYNGNALAIRVPFPQNSGTSMIPNTDKWVFSVPFDDFLENATVLRSIVIYACNDKNANVTNVTNMVVV